MRYRRELSGRMMKMTMMIQMMTSVMMRNYSHQLMRSTLLCSLWTRPKVNILHLTLIFNKQTIVLECNHGTYIVSYSRSNSLHLVLQASDEVRFQSLTQALDIHYQALANAVFQHAEHRRVEIEKEKLAKASGAAPSS